jgi:hypothetical protein
LVYEVDCGAAVVDEEVSDGGELVAEDSVAVEGTEDADCYFVEEDAAGERGKSV